MTGPAAAVADARRTLPRQRWGRRTATPAGRDQYVDGLRALALVRVVTYHAFGWVWLPAAFPSMGIMFALAGSLVAASLARGPGGHWTVLRKRVRRLLPPLWLYGAVLVALMLWQGWTVTRSEGAPLTGWSALNWFVPLEQPPGSAWGDDYVVPLWYIRTYLWLLLLSPVLYWLFRRRPALVLALPSTVLALSVLGVVPDLTPTGDTLAHLGTFGTCWLLGFAHHDGSLARLPRLRAVLGGLGLMALGLGWALTHQAPTTSWNVDEIPLANALYCAGAVLVLLRLYPRRAVLASLPRVGRLVAAMNSRAMTIYLWNNLAIMAATPLLESNPWTRQLSAPTWQGRAAQYAAAWLVLTGVVLAVGWAEDVAAGRAPRIDPWPRPRRRPGAPWQGRRSTATLLVLAAALTGALAVGVLGPASRAAAPRMDDDEGPLPGTTATRTYPLHVGVSASVFRIGSLIVGRGVDGQSLQSGWDRDWARHYGGCDGHGPVGPSCTSDLAERRGPDWFPVALVPRENPFYVGLPFNDLTAAGAAPAVPWARDPGYLEHADRSFSMVKNRWVQVRAAGGTCYAQVEDTGPGASDPRLRAGRCRAVALALDQPQPRARRLRRQHRRELHDPRRLGLRRPAAHRTMDGSGDDPSGERSRRAGRADAVMLLLAVTGAVLALGVAATASLWRLLARRDHRCAVVSRPAACDECAAVLRGEARGGHVVCACGQVSPHGYGAALLTWRAAHQGEVFPRTAAAPSRPLPTGGPAQAGAGAAGAPAPTRRRSGPRTVDPRTPQVLREAQQDTVVNES